MSYRGPSQVRFISDQTPLNEVFKIFKTSFSHLMISIAFYDPDSGERLLQEDIIQRSKAKDTRALSIRQVSFRTFHVPLPSPFVVCGRKRCKLPTPAMHS